MALSISFLLRGGVGKFTNEIIDVKKPWSVIRVIGNYIISSQSLCTSSTIPPSASFFLRTELRHQIFGIISQLPVKPALILVTNIFPHLVINACHLSNVGRYVYGSACRCLLIFWRAGYLIDWSSNKSNSVTFNEFKTIGIINTCCMHDVAAIILFNDRMSYFMRWLSIYFAVL